MAVVLEAARYISLVTIGAFMRLIFRSVAAGDRSKARGWLIGRSPTLSSSLTTPRRSGNWESQVWRELIHLTLRGRNLIHCRRCPSSLPAYFWSVGHANWDGIPIRRR